MSRPQLESLAALAASALASVAISARLLRPEVLSADALVHQYWMWRFRDPQLFTDGLTADLRESARYPDGYEALFRIASQLTSPITFGEWLGVALMAISGWLVFRIVREHTSWRPAPWIAAALFLALIDIHRFYGGFPRAFVHPVVLLTVLLAIKQRHLAAALVAAAGALFYAPAALLAMGVLVVSAVRWSAWRPQLDRRRAAFALLAVGLTLVAILGPALVAGGAPRVLSADEARMFPEFGRRGTLPFFADSTVDYLRQNRSGFDLRLSGSILALAALALLLLRPANLRLVRPEVLAMPVVALIGYAAAQAVLFRLYLPHRYTYPLVAFFAIVVGVTLRPTWTAMWERSRLHALALVGAPLAIAAFAAYVFPLAPKDADEAVERFAAWAIVAVVAGALVLGAAVAALRKPALGAALTGLLLLGAVLVVPERTPRGMKCPRGAVTVYLSKLPKDAVIAGDPIDLRCVPATARRPVVVSTQLAPAYEEDYFLKGRARMFAMLRAYYGPSARAIADLRERYGATHLWVRRDAVRKEAADGGRRWKPKKEPYGRYVRQLVSAGEPAVLHLPGSCRRWRNGPVEVYDIGCIAGTSSTTRQSTPAATRASASSG